MSYHPSTTNRYTFSLHDALPILLRVHEQALGEHIFLRGVNTDKLDVAGHAKLVEQTRAHRRTARNLFSSQPFDKVERSEEHTSELQSRLHLVCRLLLENKHIEA